MQKKHKLSLQTNNSIKETITIITITVATAVTPYTTATDRHYIALYIIRKDVTYKNIIRKSKKSLRLSLKISLRTTFRNK